MDPSALSDLRGFYCWTISQPFRNKVEEFVEACKPFFWSQLHASAVTFGLGFRTCVSNKSRGGYTERV